MTGLRDHFDLLIISEQVGVAKPDARIFDYGWRRRVTHALAVLMVGDTAEVGYSRRRERRTGDLLAQCASARAVGGPRAGLDGDLVKRTGAALCKHCLPPLMGKIAAIFVFHAWPHGRVYLED